MSRTSLSRRLGAVSTAAVLSLGLVACGGGDEADSGSASSNESSAAAEESTEASGGELEELSAEEFYPSVLAALQEAGTATYTMSSTTSVGGQEQVVEMEGALEYSGDQMSMRGTSTGPAAMEVVLVDRVFYLKSAELGPKWLKIDTADKNNPMASLLGNFDPAKSFEGLGEPKEFTLVGEEEIDGVATNHYEIVLDGAKVAEASGLPPQMQKLVPDEVPAEMWVDAENRPVKFTQEVEITTPGDGAQTITSSTEGTYGDFGSDAAIEAPPAGQTTTQIPGMGG